MRKSFRSHLTAILREADATCREAALLGAPIDEVTAMRTELARSVARRTFLAGAATASAAALLPERARAASAPRVAIVGGGIAGLACAHELWTKRGIAAQIYEWDSRLGGRIETLRGYFANGQVAEQHGEFISSEHRATLELAKAFGLSLENTNHTPSGTNDAYWFAGAGYTQAELNADWQSFGWKLFLDAVRQAPTATYLRHSTIAKQWDHMSVAEWIDTYVPGGLGGRFGKLCYADVISEYGGPPEKQSALNLLYILGFDASSPSGFQSPMQPVMAGSNERWHIHGGNDQLITGLAARLPAGSFHLGHRLVALRENPDRSFTLSFGLGASTAEIVADHVVLTIPFTTLREVDLSKVSLSPLKQRAIASLQLGNNAKIQIQVAGQPWIGDGFTGSVLTDAVFDGGWDGSSSQGAAPTGIFVMLPGGADGQALHKTYGLRLGHNQGPAPSALVADMLAAVEPIFPGMTAAWNAGPRLAWVNDGNVDPHLLGAWSQYNTGQYTGFGGIEGVQEGNIHFAGEHTSFNYQGFIEGAVRSGQRAAREI